MRLSRWITAGITAIAAFAVAGLALAASGPIDVSGLSPFATCTVGGPGTNYVKSEVEPFVAVNPTNPSNIVGVFQQDRWSNGGAHGLVASTSHDGGTTWAESWAHFSNCSGGTAANGGDYGRASDPWVTFAPNGHAYQISLSASADLTVSAVLVSKSIDGGDTWSEPTTLARNVSAFAEGPGFNDKESITADPTNANNVYAVWDRSRFPSDRAGVTAQMNAASTPGRQRSPNQFHESVIRSTDHGATWSKVIDISTDGSIAVRDPDTGAFVRSGAGLPDIAVAPNGTLYAVWSDGRFSGFTHDDVALSSSTDGGLTWSTPIKVNASPPGVAAFTPSVDVASDGTVGVSYYDFRNNTPNTSTLPTDAFAVFSHDGGATFGGEAARPG